MSFFKLSVALSPKVVSKCDNVVTIYNIIVGAIPSIHFSTWYLSLYVTVKTTETERRERVRAARLPSGLHLRTLCFMVVFVSKWCPEMSSRKVYSLSLFFRQCLVYKNTAERNGGHFDNMSLNLGSSTDDLSRQPWGGSPESITDNITSFVLPFDWLYSNGSHTAGKQLSAAESPTEPKARFYKPENLAVDSVELLLVAWRPVFTKTVLQSSFEWDNCSQLLINADISLCWHVL